MRRTAILFVTIIAMLWQSVAVARDGLLMDAAADLAHAVLHWHGQSHHHHDDGNFHLDDSTESVQHVLGDPVCTTALPMVVAMHGFAPPGSLAPLGWREAGVPDPAPDGLLRPPRFLS